MNNAIINTGKPARNLTDVLHELCLFHEAMRTEELSYHAATEWVRALEEEVATLLKRGG